MSFTAKMITGDGTITVYIDGKSYTVGREHINYPRLVNAVKEDNAEEFVEFFDVSSKVEEYLDVPDVNDVVGLVALRHGVLYYNEEKMENLVVDRVYDMMRKGYPFKYMLFFLNNLMQNPSHHSVQQLYRFLEHKNLPITSDGCFLAYKSVKTYHGPEFVDRFGRTVRDGDLVDKWSGKIRNNVGDIISCPRNEVDDNPRNHCSKGFHAGALSYAGPDGWYNYSSDTVILVKIHPANAVSVPDDHSFMKLRCCSYEVKEIYRGPLTKPVYDTDGDDLYDDDVEHFDEFDDYESEEQILFDVVPIEVDDIEEGDKLRLTYTDRYDVTKRRHVEVLEDGGTFFEVELLEDDPSYDPDIVPSIRKFKVVGIESVERIIE